MKHKIFLLALLVMCTGYGSVAQQRKQAKHYKKKRHVVVAAPPAPEIFTSVTQQAEFPGGDEALQKYLSANIRYPAAAREDGIQGIVTLRFLLEADGSISHATITKDIGGGCGREALRVIKAMPAWKPYKFNGRSIPYVVTLTTRFRLKD